MKTVNKRRALLQAGVGSLGLTALPVWAQADWPSRAIVVIVPFPAGGGTDAFARPISAVMSKSTGKQLVIDSRGGAGGNLGATLAARAAPDGYNWFMGAVHHAIAPSMYPNLEYNLEKDFIPIALVARVPQVIVVNPKKVPGDFKAFLEMVKANPGKLNYGSAGSGTSHHLAGELFKIQSKTDITHIPYKGAGPALQGLLAGDVDIMFDGLGSSAQHIKAGRLNALMVAGKERNLAKVEVESSRLFSRSKFIWCPHTIQAHTRHKKRPHVRSFLFVDSDDNANWPCHPKINRAWRLKSLRPLPSA